MQLLRPWGVVNYAFLLEMRQFGAKRFVHVAFKLNQLKFSYEKPEVTKKIDQIMRALKNIHLLNMGS